ncbi:MAG TPA: signal recognition particle protein [Bacilli bacterium]|jgi:signal recognition particle subunit SRP54|nr:signal recognition particle protein [Bacilli bacterium]MDD4344339.1 signal recognition particle protein [Bacilli bacterium]MDD4520969.1 signal recognition particle protein [Bacilli bacterium]MDY0399794.1 signal recognition particle protein [Bacilli bacterium]HKM10965.1 signal recognition particle protein [Bacilli bacterium]
MAFESLSERLQGIFKKLRGQSRLTEANMTAVLKEIQLALLEADVNFKVVREFIAKVQAQALGEEVLSKLNPSQMVVKIVHDELVELLGANATEINYQNGRPTIIMLVGLQGSGKTTTAGKLALLMKHKLNKKVLLAAADIYRPAAIDQLAQIASQIDVPLVNLGTNVKPVEIAKKARERASIEAFDVLIVDTAGRLHIDQPLMVELQDMQKVLDPQETLLLVDAASGQDAVNTAKAFHQDLSLTGVIMSKLDGDARGGAALSIRHLTNIPIKFAGVGEKLTDLDPFYPDRMADRILGMGDVLTLIEKAQENIDEKAAKKTTQRMLDGHFDLNDLISSLKQVQKLGSIKGLTKLIPGMPKISDEQMEKAEAEIKNIQVIVNSMTPEERANPLILKNSRKVRIAKGSGKTNADINRVIKKWEQMKESMKQFQKMKKGGMMPPGMGF